MTATGVQRKLVGHGLSVLTLLIAFVVFFPILWMVLTSFKTEADAYTDPPLLMFQPTLDNYRVALQESRYFDYLTNTIVITGFAALAAFILGIPAAYSLAYYPGKRSNFTMMWVMSTRMLPPVGVIVPLYIIFKNLSLFDTYSGLILLYTTMNVPLVIWMMRSFLADLPYEVIEAARIDGATLLQEFTRVILPLATPGLVATLLLCFIFTWNEFFVAFNLTITKAAPLSVFIVSFKTAEGLFWAKMSAAATITALPVVVAGWVAQRQLVRGLTAGAVK
ncbi:MAG: carbohydrate ABC transporter permease [Chloroflexota bacterium]